MTDFDESIRIETAKMAWPGRMGGILREGTKRKIVQPYFAKLNLQPFYSNISDQKFSKYQSEIVFQLAVELKPKITKNIYNPEAVAAKLVDVFMHQLTKYKVFTHLYTLLFLPLDRQVWPAVKDKLIDPSCSEILRQHPNTPYGINYKQYQKIQECLWHILEHELGDDVIQRYGKSRILLNAQWWATKD